MIGDVTQGSSQAKAAADGADTYAATLEGQQTSISGVNLDEEAVKMIEYPAGTIKPRRNLFPSLPNCSTRW